MTEPILPPVLYSVWIPGHGWLKHNGRVFADVHYQVADSAAYLYGAGAFVIPIDTEFMAAAEFQFLEQEKKRQELVIVATDKPITPAWWERFKKAFKQAE